MLVLINIIYIASYIKLYSKSSNIFNKIQNDSSFYQYIDQGKKDDIDVKKLSTFESGLKSKRNTIKFTYFEICVTCRSRYKIQNVIIKKINILIYLFNDFEITFSLMVG